MKLNILKILRGAATVASMAGTSPLSAVLSVADVLSNEQPKPPLSESPLDQTVVSALHLATQAAQAGHVDPISLVMSAVDLVHPAVSPINMPTSPIANQIDEERRKVLADRQKLADGMTRIQALIAQMKAKK
jgi:hypothetical protein